MAKLPEFSFTQGQHVRLKSHPDVQVELLWAQYVNGAPAWHVSYDPGPAADKLRQQLGRANANAPLLTNLYTEDEFQATT